MIDGFQVLECVERDARHTWYRALRLEDGLAVLLRFGTVQTTPAATLNEAALLTRLKGGAVEEPTGVYTGETGIVLGVRDRGAVFLNRCIPAEGMALDAFLTIAIAIAGAVADLHRRGVIHRDLRPVHMRFDPATAEIRLGGMRVAARIVQDIAAAPRQAMLEGDLAYISPEQTGRMNRSIDHRTDLYSIGIIFHQMLTGAVPFTAQDPLGWIHRHIARTPTPVHAYRPDVPPQISAIILRLLAKMAEQRYQGAEGLKRDLEYCRLCLETTGSIPDFALGRNDRPLYLSLAEALYGRETMVAALQQSLDRVTAGDVELVLVAGYSGIGKSALVHQIRRPTALVNGYFIEGTFDSRQRDIPFLAVAEALRDLVGQILTEGSERLTRWRHLLHQALGNNAGLMLEIVPSLELVIGPQPTVPTVSPAEAQNRFQLVLIRFLQVFAAREHPLVIFLDDLQWADSGSLRLLQGMMTDAGRNHLMVIGAYRHNEVGNHHPLTRTVDAITVSATVSLLEPQALTAKDVAHWLSDSLRAPLEQVTELAILLSQRSGGNPFFLRQLVTSLVRDQLIQFDEQSNAWVCDVDGIKAASLSEDVAVLLTHRLTMLPIRTRDVLRVAACFGNRVDLVLLATAVAATADETIEALWPAVTEGLMVLIEETAETQIFRFAHDRVQQAAFELTDQSVLPTLHLKVGRLLRDWAHGSHEAPLFDTVRNLNIARGLIEDDGERAALCRLNIMVAAKAEASFAYDVALGFIKIAQDLEQSVAEDRALRFNLHLRGAELSYLVRDFTGSEQFVQSAEALAISRLERCIAAEMRVRADMFLGSHASATVKILQALAILDIRLPQKNVRLHIARGAIALRAVRHNLQRTLQQAKPMDHGEARQAMRLLLLGLTAGFLSSSTYFPLFAIQGTRLSLDYGVAPESAQLVVGVGLTLSAMGFVESGHLLGQVARELGKRQGSYETDAAFALGVSHWKAPISESAAILRQSFISAYEAGNFRYAEYSLVLNFYYLIYSGINIEKIQHEFESMRAQIGLNASEMLMRLTETGRQFLAVLSSDDYETILQGFFTPDRIQRGNIASNGMSGAFNFVFGAFLCLLFHWKDHELFIIEQGRAIINQRPGTFARPTFAFYESLIRLGIVKRRERGRSRDHRHHRAVIRANLRRLHRWALSAPMNHSHRAKLIEAELAFLDNDPVTAADSYAQVIELATRHHFLHEAALAAELAAAFFTAIGRLERAESCLREAYRLYHDWGAKAKVAAMTAQYPDLFLSPPSLVPADGTGPLGNERTGTFDLDTVMALAQAVTSELVLDRLIDRILDLAMTNAGARFAALIAVEAEETDLVVVAERRVDAEAALVVNRPLTASSLPQPLIHYVLRSQENVVIDTIAQSPRFANHPRWADRPNCSVLCIPISHQGRVTAALYLEHELTVGAFTQDRVNLLQILASQAATALANARLFAELDHARSALAITNEALESANQDLETKVADRTQELERRSTALEQSLTDLKTAQTRLVTQEKLASLGGLVAGIAHEIRNPLNFIMNFSELSIGLMQDLAETVAPALTKAQNRDATDLVEDLTLNLRRIKDHGKRADGIIRSMLLHARGIGGERQATPLNDLIEEALMLSYKSVRGEDGNFTCAFERDFDPTLGTVMVAPQEISRVFINLFGNGFYAIRERAMGTDGAALGLIKITTRRNGETVEIRVRDNGIGIPPAIQEKLFTPFFTTKPAGQGTGLGLSLSYDTIRHHGGTFHVESVAGEYAEFTVTLPVNGGPRLMDQEDVAVA